MSKFEINYSNVKDSVIKLRELLKRCEEAYNKEVPSSNIDKGKTHDELVSLCENINKNFICWGELVNKTILFLGDTSEMFETGDKNTAKKIV